MNNRHYILFQEKIKTYIRSHFTGLHITRFFDGLVPYSLRKEHKRERMVSIYSKEPVPSIYNEKGKKIEWIYMGGDAIRYCFTAGRTPQFIQFNHFDVLLPVHFYSFLDIQEAKKDIYAKKKCLYILESRKIISPVYDYLLKHEKDMQYFDFIFTSDNEILEKYENARFCPASGVWYGTERWGGKPDLDNFKNKTKNISILSSSKVRCEMHKFRLALAKKYKNLKSVDTFGTFDDGMYAELPEALDEYRYSIIIENDQSPFYFTEKIMNCFASLTVPIYIGASRIGDFFNIEGIIQIANPSMEAVEKAIGVCTEQDYHSRHDAIVDNFERVKQYLTPEDYIYMHYKNELFS